MLNKQVQKWVIVFYYEKLKTHELFLLDREMSTQQHNFSENIT